jgi:hypothetical protein
MFRKSKPYVAVLLGGYPASIDKVMEFVADHKRHLSFIYGINVFVIYFNSKAKLNDIRKIFITTMRKEVEMIFVFEDGNKSVQYVSPHIKEKVNAAQKDRQNIIGGDLSALREVLYLIASRYSMMPPPQQYTENGEPVEQQPLTDTEIVDQLIDKMKSTGYESLTPAELDFLREYKTKRSKNDQNDQTNVD